MKCNVGIVGTGVYLPDHVMTAKEISEATRGVWTEDAIRTKLGIIKKRIPEQGNPNHGTQEMGVLAARDCLVRTGVPAESIDLIISIGEEWKEFPLTTSAIYIQEKIGSRRAWAIDVQQRCCTCVAAMKMAKDMMIADDEINTVLIVGGYRNCDFLDFTNKSMSMMYNLGAGGGALILRKNFNRNLLLGTHIMTDGSLARDAGVKYGGTAFPINEDNLKDAYHSLMIFDEEHMKNRLNEVSMNNWLYCMGQAFKKSNLPMSALSYLAVLHFKESMHTYLLNHLNLTPEQTTYLAEYGHIGQLDQILSIHLGLQDSKIKDGSVISMIAAGIGYAWAANVIKWGPE